MIVDHKDPFRCIILSFDILCTGLPYFNNVLMLQKVNKEKFYIWVEMIKINETRAIIPSTPARGCLISISDMAILYVIMNHNIGS